MQKNEVYLKHILDAIVDIEEFSGDSTQPEFVGNKLVQSAVIRQLEIIGEAVKNISADVKKAHPSIPWKDIAGLRDKLIHAYFGIDYDLVWTIVRRDIPELKQAITKILKT